LILALVLGVLFVEWPEHAIWNTRFLPFWLFTWGLLAAMGATEICRWLAMAVTAGFRWIKEGDVQDARARAWAEIATSEDDPTVDPEARKEAAWVLAERRFDHDPAGWTPPERFAPGTIKRQARKVSAVALAIITAGVGIFALQRAWNARNGNPAIAITGWADWNYSGYESKAAYPQYHAIMTGMDDVARQYGNGRALWEPSSGDPDAINSYGTSLALELLPYFTHGRIDSMEGIYFESSATTSYHFLTVSECAKYVSNPVRGLDYGNLDTDFDRCVKHLQMLGVKYLMLWTPEANAKAANAPDLKLIKTIEQNPPISGPSNSKLSEWKVYEVADSDLVVGMNEQPVVASTHAGTYSQCWGQPYPDTTTREPELGAWECTVAPWWMNSNTLDVAFAQSGPKEWPRVDGKKLADVTPTKIDDPAQVSEVKTSVDKISFHVDQLGKPVEIKESYFPNWQVKGAKGPYRLAPNMMVVVPTSHDVTLTYGLTKADWLGRFLTVLGLVGVVLLALWTGARRFAAGAPAPPPVPRPSGDESGSDEGPSSEDNGNGDDAGTGPEQDHPPDRREPAPALP